MRQQVLDQLFSDIEMNLSLLRPDIEELIYITKRSEILISSCYREIRRQEENDSQAEIQIRLFEEFKEDGEEERPNLERS